MSLNQNGNWNVNHKPFYFRDIVGQDKTKEELQKRLVKKALPSVLLFDGPRGTGKTSLANVIMHAVNCRDLQPDGEPCGKCKSCQYFLEDRNFSNISRQVAKDITKPILEKMREDARTTSAIAKTKIFLIDEFQGAFKGNTGSVPEMLLTFFEETFKHDVYFILSTMEGHLIPPAWKTRASGYFKMDLVSPEGTINKLFDTCEREGIEVTDEIGNALVIISEYAKGHMRDAILYLEKAHFSNTWKEAELRELIESMGAVSNETTIDLTAKLIKKDFSVLNKYITIDMFNTIEEILLLTAKRQKGANLNTNDSKKIGSLYKLDHGRVLELLDLVMETKRFGYVTTPMVNWFLLKAIGSELVKLNESERPQRKVRGTR